MLRIMIASFAILAAAPLAHAQERYQLERSGEGFVRLDTQSGAMTYCTASPAGLDCRDGGTSEAAPSDDTSARIAELERRITALESGPANAGLPSDEEFEKTLGFMERFFRTFIGIVRETEQEQPSGSRT